MQSSYIVRIFFEGGGEGKGGGGRGERGVDTHSIHIACLNWAWAAHVHTVAVCVYV